MSTPSEEILNKFAGQTVTDEEFVLKHFYQPEDADSRDRLIAENKRLEDLLLDKVYEDI